MLVCIIAGLISGCVTGYFVNVFVCGSCELNQYISWCSYICYGVPIITGVLAGYNNDVVLVKNCSISNFLDLVWNFIKIIIKVAFSGAVISLIAFLIGVIIVFFDSGAVFVAILFIAVVTAATAPILRIVIEL